MLNNLLRDSSRRSRGGDVRLDGTVPNHVGSDRKETVVRGSKASRDVSRGVGEPLTLAGANSNNNISEKPPLQSDGIESPSDEVDDETRLVTSPVDQFELDRERFIQEQKRTPWIQAMIAFLEDGALASNAQLRVKILQTVPHYVVRNGMLMRRVHRKARPGYARTITLPVIPLPFIETVLHYCPSDVFAAHICQTKTMDKVRKHAYWHGWKKDVAEYARACSVCGSGEGYRPWKNGLTQRMPIPELSRPFSLLVVGAIEPLFTTPRGNKFMLVFADYFTRWVEAFPVETLDTLTFVRVMVDEVLSCHGVPERLRRDRIFQFHF
ncbi:unnamed protein product [Phytophthora fragariaefolia]|uniref:Unnamed protein product n=1 Tax=Phytophthora fragariaefolia TaxID=1490495 RepID=A0A9W6YHY8_9STRA|nr:unnamed protein product [Phytophthora fragariaefolia]